ncbi:ABC transporter permease [Castellaniella defragrans]|uniref:ABC transporter permease n=1 Tax=Castellaniella defragrans TaxID=75697 RepID=UPI002AFF271C|nr:ABC transporter permease [Castellaniella defragrans]
MLGWIEIRQRYARSKIGPFWLTISMGVMILALGVVYGALFKANLGDYMPMLAVGLVFWTFISSTLTDGCNTYINASAYLRQVSLPRGIFILQNLWRNSIILAHNVIIVLLVLLVFRINALPHLGWFVLGLALLIVNLLWISLLLAAVCARFRDFPQIIASILQVVFYVTPILFKRDMLDKYPWLIDINPFAHLIEVVRAPLLAQTVPLLSWQVCGTMALLGCLVTLVLHGRYLSRIPYWV